MLACSKTRVSDWVADAATVTGVGAPNVDAGICTAPTFGKAAVTGVVDGTETVVVVPTTATGASNAVGRDVTEGSSDNDGVSEGTEVTEGC